MSTTNRDFYEAATTVQAYSDRYNPLKEDAFCARLARSLPPTGSILELGGGSGVHGASLARRHPDYVHTDYSEAMCRNARAMGLKSHQLNALEIHNEAIPDIIVAIDLSTIATRDPEIRARQFDALNTSNAQWLLIETGVEIPFYGRPDGVHALNRADIAMLDNYRLIHWYRWGGIPGRFWNQATSPLLGSLEDLLSRFGLGWRRVAVLTKDAAPAP